MRSDGWFRCALGEQVMLQRGYDISKQEQTSGEVPVISSGGTKSYHNEAKESGPGVLLGRKGTVGTVYYTKQDYWPHSTTLFVKNFCGNNPRFVYYYFLSIAELLKNMDVGTSNPTLNRNHLHPMQILWPRKTIQDQIANVLSVLDDKIELNQKINENLERQAQAIFAERFAGFAENDLPSGWRIAHLGDVASISNKSFNPNKEPETLLEHYSIPAFDEARFPVFELSASIKSNKFIVDADCFMISKLNPTTKRVWKPYCISDHAVCSTEFIVYKAKNRQDTDFLFSLIDSDCFSDFMCSHVTGSTGSRQRTTPSDTLQFEFVLPPVDEIEAFSAIVGPMYQRIKANAIENHKLKSLRDTLLPKLMAGEIEMAGEL